MNIPINGKQIKSIKIYRLSSSTDNHRMITFKKIQ